MTVELESRRFRDLERAKKVEEVAEETDNADSIGEEEREPKKKTKGVYLLVSVISRVCPSVSFFVLLVGRAL